MLDQFEILSTSGVVLWSKTYVPVGAGVINSLIKDIFIEERSATAFDDSAAAQKPTYRKEGYTLKWTTAKDLGLIFVAVYQSLLHLSWIDKLLDNIRALFTELYRDQLKQPHTTSFNGKFDDYFDRQVQELERLDDGSSARPSEPTSSVELTPPSSSGGDPDDVPPPIPGLRKAPQKAIYSDTTSTDVTPVPTPETSRPNSPAMSHLLAAKVGPAGRTSRRGRKQAAATTSSAILSSGDESPARRAKASAKGSVKKKRVWDADGLAADEDGDTILDYSAPAASDSATPSNSNLEAIDQSTWGSRTKGGDFVLKDLDEEIDSILASTTNKHSPAPSSTPTGLVNTSLNTLSGLFRNVVGGKTLTRADLDKPLKAMEDHLLKKNVAREAAVRLCESVAQDLLNTKTNSFTSIDATIRSSMESALRKMLTPTTSLDLLRSIQSVRQREARPYVISIVGVNGVGKSTNLSKLAFFLLQNKLRILIVAADTFRSGAVEQLRVHVRNLQELSAREAGGAVVDLYERGYGKDAAHIAKEAVEWGARHGFDVVLIDTAGRRHNDQRLMSSLEKFARMARPDRIFQVAEALVGGDAVQQARNFNESFGTAREGREGVGVGGRRNLDGFVVSKCDTVGDMVGTLVSMVHATGIPVVFLGTGQHYSDLRGFNVGWAVRLLMS